MAVLEQGGNAFDAAVAAGFTLQVVEPHLNGPGGDMPGIFYAKKDGRPRVLCAPGAGTRCSQRSSTFVAPGPADDPRRGLAGDVCAGRIRRLAGAPATITAPGACAIASPIAIGYARSGIPVLPNIHNTTAKVAKLFREQWPTSAEVYLDQGNVPAVGSWFCNPKLASHLRAHPRKRRKPPGDREDQIEAARRIWYEGWVAEAIDAFYTNAGIARPLGPSSHGRLTRRRLASWRATYDEPCN